MDLLGNTLEKIAYEKAGIIKEKVPVVISEKHAQTNGIFISKAEENCSPVSFAGDLYSCMLGESESYNTEGERGYIITDLVNGVTHEGTIPLLGDYQSHNLQAVYAASRSLKRIFCITDKCIKDGISKVVENTGLRGRWQVLDRQPLVICDTGHNREGLEFVLRQIERIPKSALHMIIGFVNDKDLNSVLPLFPVVASYYFTKASVPRALNEEVLMAEAHKFGLKGQCFPDVKMALASARENADDSDLIFIGGSTFIVGEVV
jgi:dihydrofolate synthase/folylpolyglutamate synthase